MMRRQGRLRPGAITAGPQSWSWAATGEESGSVNISVDLSNPDAGLVIVTSCLNGVPQEQSIQLAWRPMTFGGRRYYFICPRQSRWCEVLPMSGGVFASRQAHKLTYQSQSEDRLGRLRDRALRLERRVLGKGSPKPRGQNRRRLLDEWCRADSAFETLFATTVTRRWGHLL
ncbi:hypothetical protein M9M90_09745 [Phenylobacterium sp. LH3H17]|uniref:hypothetical protein n=1 Tax=Phenylobacterium sp. LH3H17 TaxID=2903901 RepID=UPI0020C98595|nr:hypothetical protein [Phenylobacterium sp. LH3H17]UTP41435.1 hypothetical protein M9M90_09745 [Phenylobacterium sp. LH3H17]